MGFLVNMAVKNLQAFKQDAIFSKDKNSFTTLVGSVEVSMSNNDKFLESSCSFAISATKVNELVSS